MKPLRILSFIHTRILYFIHEDPCEDPLLHTRGSLRGSITSYTRILARILYFMHEDPCEDPLLHTWGSLRGSFTSYMGVLARILYFIHGDPCEDPNHIIAYILLHSTIYWSEWDIYLFWTLIDIQLFLLSTHFNGTLFHVSFVQRRPI